MDAHQIRSDIALARRGETEALDRVLKALESRLRAAATNRLAGHLRARMGTSDLLQSTMLDIAKNIGDFRGENADQLLAWSGRIMDNNLRDRARFFGRQRRRGEHGAEVPPDAVASGPTPSFEAMRVEHIEALYRALSELPDDYQQILQLREFEKREYDEIAATLDRSEGAVRMLISRARAALYVKLDRMLGDDDDGNRSGGPDRDRGDAG